MAGTNYPAKTAFDSSSRPPLATTKWTDDSHPKPLKQSEPTVVKKRKVRNVKSTVQQQVGDTSNNESDLEKFSLPTIVKLSLQNFLDLKQVEHDYHKAYNNEGHDSDEMGSDSCSSAA